MFPSDAGVDNLSHINEEEQIITWSKSAKKSNDRETQKMAPLFSVNMYFPGVCVRTIHSHKMSFWRYNQRNFAKNWLQKLRKSKN